MTFISSRLLTCVTLLAAATLTYSCSSDDDSEPGPAAGKAGRAGGGGKGGAGGKAGAAGKGGSGGKAGKGGSSGGSSSGGEGGGTSGSGGQDAGGQGGGGDVAGAGGEGGSGNGTCSDTFTITVTCVDGPCAQLSYIHTYDVKWTGSSFKGTGSASEGGQVYKETITGGVAKSKLTFHAVYTTIVPDYTIDGTATVASDGSATGTAKGEDPGGAEQDFTAVVSPMNVACAN